ISLDCLNSRAERACRFGWQPDWTAWKAILPSCRIAHGDCGTDAVGWRGCSHSIGSAFQSPFSSPVLPESEEAMLFRTTLSFFAALVLAREAVPLQAAELIRPAQFGQLHAMIKPQRGEAPWAEIAWITDLWEARKKAAAEGKPILFWSASGEPLGCT